MFHLRLHARVTFPTNRSAAPEDVGLWCGFRREQTWTQSGVQRSHRPQWDPSLDVPAASGRRLGVPQQMRCFSSEHFPTIPPPTPSVYGRDVGSDYTGSSCSSCSWLCVKLCSDGTTVATKRRR